MGLGSFKTGTNGPGKWQPRQFWLKLKSSEVGILKAITLQRSSVQPTIAFSELISNVNISFCTLIGSFSFCTSIASFSIDFWNGLILVYTGTYWYMLVQTMMNIWGIGKVLLYPCLLTQNKGVHTTIHHIKENLDKLHCCINSLVRLCTCLSRFTGFLGESP